MQNKDNGFPNNPPYASSREGWKNFISLNVFSKLENLSPSAWTEHVPFSFWLIDSVRPGTLVELGTHYGMSYFSFCQAVKKTGTSTKCFAVDNWKGDEHAGFYDESVFEYVKKTNEQYNNFSQLIRSSFDEALSLFPDQTIDLLHIDGLHTYEAVKHDFYNWLPTLSEKGIVLFHDTNVRENQFGVYKLWEELSNQYPSFEFKHGYGLGILGVGRFIPKKIKQFFEISLNPAIKDSISHVYERLGGLYKFEQDFIFNSKDTESLYPSEQNNTNHSISFLNPLDVISVQIFWKKKDEEFNEGNSFIQKVNLTHFKTDYSFQIDQDLFLVNKLRIDPATSQGAFYFYSTCVLDSNDKIILDWESIKQKISFQNLIAVKSSVHENAYLFLCLTDDPTIEIELPVIDSPSPNETFKLIVTLSGQDNEILKRELYNLTISQITEKSRYGTEPGDALLGTLQTLKEDILNRLVNQQASLDKFIETGNALIQQKAGLMNEMTGKLEETENVLADLREDILQKQTEIKSLSSLYEISQNKLLEISDQKEGLVKELAAREKLMAISKKEIDDKEDLLKDLKNKIVIYEHSSVFKFIKTKMTKKRKEN